MNSLPGDLTTLVQTALALDGTDRRHAAGRINDWLRIRHQVATELERDEVLMWMDHPDFSELSDGDARNCRAEAAELLLSLGYPSALCVSPEALLAARRQRVAPVLDASVWRWVVLLGLPPAFLLVVAPFVVVARDVHWIPFGSSFELTLAASSVAIAGWAFKRAR